MYTDIPFWLSAVFMFGGLFGLAWSSDVFVDGNIIGSNLFNTLAVVGFATVISPLVP